jgi:hypothetical protein
MVKSFVPMVVLLEDREAGTDGRFRGGAGGVYGLDVLEAVARFLWDAIELWWFHWLRWRLEDWLGGIFKVEVLWASPANITGVQTADLAGCPQNDKN